MKSIFTIVLCLCAFILACDEGEVELWDASNLSSGIYILSMQPNDFINSQKISLTK